MESKPGLRVLRLIIFIILTSVAVQQSQAATVQKSAVAATQLDPVLAYSTYLSDFYPSVAVSAVDAAGNACVVFGPSTLTKLRSDGSVIFSRQDSGCGGAAVAIDAQGNCYVAGRGTITATAGAFQSTGGPKQCVTKFDATGQVVYATYLGGSGQDELGGLAVDAVGNAYLAGSTASNDFPTAHPFQVTPGGAGDVYVAVLNATGTGLVYSTYLGGSGSDRAAGIAVDSSGNAYVTGETDSQDFPVVAALQPNSGGDRNAFVVKLDPTGNPIYSTYLGGTGFAAGGGIAADASGNAYVVGTAGVGFPLVGPGQSFTQFSNFIAKLNPAGSALVFSSPFASNLETTKIVVDSNQRMYIAGNTSAATNSVSALQQNFGGGATDGYVTVLDSSESIVFSTLLGGSRDENFTSVGVDSAGNIYVSGSTDGNFPIVNAENGTYEPFYHCMLHEDCSAKVSTQPFVLKIAPVSGTALAVPSLVDFQALPAPVGSSTEPASILVANPNSSNSILISGIVVAGDFSQTNNCPVSLNPGGSCTLTTIFTPTGAGTRTGTVTISDSAPGSPHVIKLIGTTLSAELDIGPGQLPFGSVPVGSSSSTQAVTLTNSGGATLSIESVLISGDFTETNTCGLSLAASNTCQIAVAFTPTGTGDRTGTLTVSYGAPGSPQVIPLSGIGTGTAPVLGLAPGGPTSATVAAGGTASYGFSIGGAGMNGTATLSCTGAPTGATCSVPGTESLSSTVPTSFNVTVTTTARTLGALRPPSSTPMPWLATVVLLGALVLCGTRMPRLPGRRYLLLVPLALAFFQFSCGGGSSTPPNHNPTTTPTPNGTPAGTYTLTVKATAGSATETSALTLVVQ